MIASSTGCLADGRLAEAWRTLEDVRTATGAPYASEAEDLATFLDEQTRRIVGTYRGAGRCTASNAEEQEEGE